MPKWFGTPGKWYHTARAPRLRPCSRGPGSLAPGGRPPGPAPAVGVGARGGGPGTGRFRGWVGGRVAGVGCLGELGSGVGEFEEKSKEPHPLLKTY